MRGRYRYYAQGYGCCGPAAGPPWMHRRPSDEEILGMLEEYQRDLEQEVEDVAQRIKELREKQGEKAGV